MQPNEYRSDPYGQSSIWDGYAGEEVTVRRTRSWAVALAAFVTCLVLMAAIGNPAVTDAIRKHITGRTFKDGVLFSVNSIQWRFGAASGDVTRQWASHLLTDVAALVLIFLLVWVVANGRGGFWQAFFGTWVCAIASFMLATYVGTAVLDQSGDATSKAVLVFFGPTTSPATTLFAALGYGLVIALVAALVAVLTRDRRVAVDASSAGAPAPGYYPPGQQQPQERTDYPQVPGPVATPSPWSGGGGDHPTESLPRTEEQDRGPQPTAVLPSVGGPERPGSGNEQQGTERQGTEQQGTEPQGTEQQGTEQQGTEQQGAEQHTTQLPRTDEQGGNEPETGQHGWPPPRRDG